MPPGRTSDHPAPWNTRGSVHGRRTIAARASASSTGTAATTIARGLRDDSTPQVNQSSAGASRGGETLQFGRLITSLDGAVAMPRVLVLHAATLLAEAVAIALRATGLAVGSSYAPGLHRTVVAAQAFHPGLALVHVDGTWSCRDVEDHVEALIATNATVMLLTEGIDASLVAAGIDAGAEGVLTASDTMVSAEAMIARLARGEPLVQARARHRARPAGGRTRPPFAADGPTGAADGFSLLTCREAEVLRHLAEGIAVARIAELSFTSVETVRSQVRAIRQKLGVPSQLAAVALAYRTGWVTGTA